MRVPSALLLALLATPSTSRALGWDEASERVELEGAILALDFELGRTPELDAYAADGSTVAPSFIDEGAANIEGERALRAGGQTPYVAIDLRSVREALIGRRVEMTLWQRPHGTRLTGDLRWSRADLTLAAIAIQPTGRVTTDGWEEWTTGPIDFALDGLTPSAWLLYDEQYYTVYTELDREVWVAVDAIAIADLGPALVPSADCRLASEREDCGAAGVCTLGRCADAAAVLGAPLYAPSLRRDQLARHAFELEAFAGNRRARALLPGFRALVAWAEDASTVEHWERLHLAYDTLRDGHARAPIAGVEPPISSGTCAYESVADLLPGAPILPMVYGADPRHPIGEALEAGDVIVAIDALPPYEWALRAARSLQFAGDPARRRADITPQLLDAAARAGSTVAIARCDRDGACVSLELDLAAIVRAAFEGRLSDELARAPFCDFRFRRPVSSDRVAARLDFAGSLDTGRHRAIQINATPSDRDWFDGIERAFTDAPDRLLLDHRYGAGGNSDAVELLVSRLLGPSELDRAELWPWLGDSTPAALSSCLGCGDVVRLDLLASSPRRGIAARAKLAVLQSHDLAGNDLVARALGSRREGVTRTFGPSPTIGAFGPKAELPRLPGEVRGPTFQSHDTRFVIRGVSEAFEGGRGVSPDVVVLQTQRDALRGVDTALEAARAWLEAP